MMTKKTDIAPQPFDSDSDALAWLQEILLMEEPHFQVTCSSDIFGYEHMVHLRLLELESGRFFDARGLTLKIALEWLRDILRSDAVRHQRGSDDFYSWWVAEKGRPPTLSEGVEFEIAKKAWEESRK
jgi:hypothetical protein